MGKARETNPYKAPAPEPPPASGARLPPRSGDVEYLVRSALKYATFAPCCMGPFGLVAFLRSHRALNIIHDEGVGHEFARMAAYVRVLGALQVLVFVVALATRC